MKAEKKIEIFKRLSDFVDQLDDMPDGAFFAAVENKAQRLMKKHGIKEKCSNDLMFEFFEWLKNQGFRP